MTNCSEEIARSCVLSQTGASADDVLLRLGELEIGKSRGATGTFSVKAMEGDDAVQEFARRAFKPLATSAVSYRRRNQRH